MISTTRNAYQAHRYWASCELRLVRAMVRIGNMSQANAQKLRVQILLGYAKARRSRGNK